MRAPVLDPTVNKPLVITVTNPCASTGSSTISVCLAGFYASMNKRVLLLHSKQCEDWASWLESRPVDKPKIDCCLLENAALLKHESQDCTNYDVIIVDFVRFMYVSDQNMGIARKTLKSVCERSDVMLVPFNYAYPMLDELSAESRSKRYISIKAELQNYAELQEQANILLLMNRAGIPDEGFEQEDDGAHIQTVIKMNSDLRKRLDTYVAELDIDGIRVCGSMIGNRTAYGEMCSLPEGGRLFATDAEGNFLTPSILNVQTPSDMPLTISQQAALRELNDLANEIARYAFYLDSSEPD